jgi:tetraacyldisaccharide 4'-kinase
MGIFEFIYFAGYRIKKAVSLKRRKRLPVKVISIGNITTGGTGKTPFAIALAEEALRRGMRPCILTRGYKGSAKGPCFVSRGEGPILTDREAGDEPVLMAQRLKGVPVVKGKDRHRAGMFALENAGVGLFILDDGFQHFGLIRDIDILLIDAGDPFDNERLLPMGLLREPLSEIKRADIIVVTKAVERQGINALIDRIRKFNPGAPVYTSRHRALDAVVHATGERFGLERLKGKDVYAFCGIGKPRSFKSALELSGAILKGFKAYKDHYKYKKSDIEYIENKAKASAAEWIITTEKDIMRLGKHMTPDNLLYLRIEAEVDEGFYDEVFK